jgi:glycosyltransferase involved in cell wall biosynthesis
MGVDRILIIGIGNPTPSFIKRRLQALGRVGIRLCIIAEHGQPMGDYKKATIVRIGGRQSLKIRLKAIAGILARPFRFWKLLSIRTEIPWPSRIKWAVKYFPLTLITPPNVVHFQWLSFLPEFQWLRQYYKCPFIGSARGSQVTVYPYTRVGYKIIMQDAIRLADYIHCVSSSMRQACLELGAAPNKLFVNYNGIDLGLYKATIKHQRKTNEFVLISVGNMMWRKGYGYQLQVIKKLVDAGRSVKLIWLGDGPDKEGLLYTSKVLGLTSRVQFVGKVNSTEISNWLSEADAYLSTSAAEGLSNSMVEAAACSLPILAFTCEGTDEVISEGENGFVVPFGDIDRLRDKITYLMDNNAICLRMGQHSRKIAEERFNEKLHIEAMRKFYSDLKR